MRRKKNQDAFSLFAFQDIITSVTGIILLIALILALELIQKDEISETPGQKNAVVPSVATSQTEIEVSALRQQVLSSEEMIAQLATFPSSDLLSEKKRLERKLLELQEKPKAIAPTPQKNTKEQLEQIENEVLRLEGKYASLEKSQRVYYNKDTTTNKIGWIIDIKKESIKVSSIGESQSSNVSSGRIFNGVNDTLTWSKQRDSKQEYFVLVVRPQAISTFSALRYGLKNAGYDLGFDVIGSQTVIDSIEE